MASRWYTNKIKHPLPDSVDATEMLEFINQNNQEGVYYHVVYASCTPAESRCFAVKANTVKKIIENGYKNIDLWVYANRFKNIWQNGKSVACKIENRDAFVIDLDDSRYSSLEELITDFNKRKVPLPIYATQTSPKNFHLMYRADRDVWKFYTKLKLCYMICGIDIFPKGEQEIEKTLRNHGIDYGYLKQNSIYSKIRVGGSFNYKKCLFKVRGWFNHNYNYNEVIKSIRNFVIEHNTYYLPTKENLNEDDKKEQKKRKVRLYKKYESKRKLFEDIIKSNFPFKKDKNKEKTNTLIDLIMNNMNRLINGSMYISQEYWSKKLNIDQSNVSRLLKKLINLDIIKVTNQYYSYREGDKKSKTYGFTKSFIETLYKYGKNKKAQKNQDDILLTPYKDGMTNTQIMSDIRVLFLDRGCSSVDDISEFIYAKDCQRPKEKQRGYKTIRYFVSKYMTYLNEKYRANNRRVI